MAEKEITKRESMRNLTLSTLERKLIPTTLGANLASDKTKYGTSGAESAKYAFNGEDIKKAKEEEYQRLIKENEALGVAGDPSYAYDNAYISNKIISGLEHVMENSYLEDLAEGINKFAPELEFELPEKLKDYVYAELMEKATEEKDGKRIFNPEKLNEDENIALGVYEKLREAYRLTAAKKVMDSNYLGGPKKYLDSVMEKYNPTPKEEDKE